MEMKTCKRWIRLCRGWLYRRLPSWSTAWHRKKLAGYERRWGLEQDGFTKEGFFRILQKNMMAKVKIGDFYELVAGDGLVGSLGTWLERGRGGWRVKAWEHRSAVFKRFRHHRPSTKIHHGRLTRWENLPHKSDVKAVTGRGVREAAGLCREIRKGKIRPVWMGIWNPTRRPVWYRRMKREGYRLEFVWHNMEFYGRTKP